MVWIHQINIIYNHSVGLFLTTLHSVHTSKTYCSPRTACLVLFQWKYFTLWKWECKLALFPLNQFITTHFIHYKETCAPQSPRPDSCGTPTCETNGSYDVSVSVATSPLDTTTIFNGTGSRLDQQLSWGMPILPHFFQQLPGPGVSSDGSKAANITKEHNYSKATNIWARWYTANSNTKL